MASPIQQRIEHRTKDELILAIADFVAGARTDHLCGVTDQPHALLAHRIDYDHAVILAWKTQRPRDHHQRPFRG